MKRWKLWLLCAWAVLMVVMICGCMDSNEIVMAKQRLAEVKNMASKCNEATSKEVCCQGLQAAVKAIEKDIVAAED